MLEYRSNIKLSPSSLNIFLECPRCFWLDKNKNIKRPRGIFPSLPGGMDIAIKHYFDSYRLNNDLPPEIKGKVCGNLFSDSLILEKWRNWKLNDLFYEDKENSAILTGALDDCLVDKGYYIPLDYKTRGSEIKEDSLSYYQNQLDCYCLILEASGYKTKNLAYLVYYWPIKVSSNGTVKFHVEPFEVKTNIESAKATVRKAAKSLLSDMPLSNPNCEYCNLVSRRKGESFEKWLL